MLAFLLSNVEDYLRALFLAGKDFQEELKKFREKDDEVKTRGQKAAPKTDQEFKKFRILAQGEKSKIYLFSNSKSSEESPLGFNFICWYFGFNPKKIRGILRRANRGTLKKFFGAYCEKKGGSHE